MAGHLLVDGGIGLLDGRLVVDEQVNRVDARVAEVGQDTTQVDGFFGGVSSGVVLGLGAALCAACLSSRAPRDRVVGDLEQPARSGAVVVISVAVVGGPVCVTVPDRNEVAAMKLGVTPVLEGVVSSTLEVAQDGGSLIPMIDARVV